MASIYHPTYSSGKASPYWNLKCYKRSEKRYHYIALKYPDGSRVANREDAKDMRRIHELECDRKPASPARTFSQAIDEYLASTAGDRTPRGREQEELKAKRLKKYFGSAVLTEMDPSRVQAGLNQLVTDGKGKIGLTTRDHYLKLLKSFSRWCVIIKRWIPGDFTVGVARQGKNASRTHLPREKWGALLEKAQRSKYYPCVMLLLFTGLRRNEALRLEKRDFDLKGKVVLLRPEIAKTNEAACLPLGDDLIAALRPVLEDLGPTERVFPYYGDALQRRVRKWLEEMGYKEKLLGLHTLRHSFVTHAYNNFKTFDAQQLARHTSLEMTRRYTHLKKMPVSPEQMNSF